MTNRKRKASKRKKINPKFWVFCEGKTERSYVCFLRSKYRLPIEIIPEITGSRITQRLINKYKSKKLSHPKDKVFLLYDSDVSEIIDKLTSIKDVELLTSNPAIEYWFLLHYKNQSSSITTEECIRQINNRNKNTYKKGILDNKLKEKLEEKWSTACKRSSSTTVFNNPSTNIHKFIEILEKEKLKK